MVNQSILLNSAIPSDKNTSNSSPIPEDSAQASRNSRVPQVPTQLIMLPINNQGADPLQPEVLPMFGTVPRWLP